MKDQEETIKVADWVYRNPNGLQPVVTFPEDYTPPGHIHYNVPPLRLEASRSSASNLTNATATRNPASMQRRGYTGAKSFFTQQPPPSSTALFLTSEHTWHCNRIGSVTTKRLESPLSAKVSLPCNNVVAAAEMGRDTMKQMIHTKTHSMQISFADPRIWRFDARNHAFQQKLSLWKDYEQTFS